MEASLGKTIADALKQAGHLNQSDTPSLDCQLLLSHLLTKDRAWFISHSDAALSSTEWQAFASLIQRRQDGEPIAYITGFQAFWLDEFKVSRDTLIPRPETELIIETLLEITAESDSLKNTAKIVDLGTGTGAIAISLARELPNAEIYASDQSNAALLIAKDNNQRLGTDVNFVQGNWLRPFKGQQFDIIISNPPYIDALDDHLSALSYEPLSALVAQEAGFSDLYELITSAQASLKPGGRLMLEHGFEQQDELVALLETQGYIDIKALSDLSGNPRVVLATNPYGQQL